MVRIDIYMLCRQSSLILTIKENLKLYFITIPYSATPLQYLNPITLQPTPKRWNHSRGWDLKFHSLSRFNWSTRQMLDISCERQIKEFPLCHLYLYQSSPQWHRMLTDKIKNLTGQHEAMNISDPQHSPKTPKHFYFLEHSFKTFRIRMF